MLHQRMFESGSYKSVPKHIALYEALEASMERAQKDEFLAKKDKSRKRRRDDQDPLLLHQNQILVRGDDMTLALLVHHGLKLLSQDTNTTYLLKTKQRPEWFKPIPDDDRPAIPEPAWVDWANPTGDQVRIDVSKPLPLRGPLGHVTIQTHIFFNHDLDYLRYGGKGTEQALSISKMKVACYLDFGLELLVPEHIWINEVCTYDISDSYGISHWWFNRQKFNIDRHIADSSRKIVRTHMRILSVVSKKAFSRYGCDYLKEITLHRAGYQEYTIVEKDFKSLYPSDFEDLSLLLLQGHLNHLSGSDKRFKFKHDYTIIESPRAIVFPIGNNERKIMRFNEIYKFSDGTLTNIMEVLDYRVKEYKDNRLNPGINTWFWTDKDVERSKEFIHAIERRLKTRRIFWNLECFVSGRVHDIDYKLLQRTK
nr:hypothetical protein [Tanacetum cinerariifolium]